MDYYLAVVEGPEAEDGFSVFFPDFDGLGSAGRTIAEAARNAEEALEFHVRGMREDGLDIPPPSTSFHMDTDVDVHALLSVPLFTSGPMKPATISMPDGQLRRIDMRAKELGMSRSSYLVESARKEMEGT